MDTRKTAARLLSKNCFMASVDLKDAYYSVSVAKEYRKYLRFFWDGQLFQFTTLPNGLACAPRLFTKLLKPVYATLRQEGHCCLGYIDDSFIVGDTWSACQTAVDSAVRLLTELGFQINLEKSVLTPTQTLTFLGYEFNSVDMTSRLTSEKRDLMKSHCNTILLSIQPTIREVAQVNGLMVAYSEGVEYGPLNYRCLEREKIAALRANRGNYDLTMSLSQESRCELKWWILNVDQAVKAISHGNPNLTVTSDASKLGWGAEFQGSTTGGRWTEAEACQHINQLELKAGFLALKSFCPHVSHTHIRLRMDNVTAVTYVNDMGGSHSSLWLIGSMSPWVLPERTLGTVRYIETYPGNYLICRTVPCLLSTVPWLSLFRPLLMSQYLKYTCTDRQASYLYKVGLEYETVKPRRNFNLYTLMRAILLQISRWSGMRGLKTGYGLE